MIFIFAIFNTCYSSEIHPNAGTTSASFLKIGIGARPVGMGEAFVAVADDANSVYWNPAGLARVKKMEFTAMHNEWFQDIRYEFIAYAHPFENGSTGAFHLGSLYLKGLERRSWLTEDPEDDPSLAEDLFGAADYEGAISYSGWLTENLMGGANLKFIYETIDKYNASGFAFDLGLIYKIAGDNLTSGLVLQNLGPKLTFIQRGYMLPLTAKLGFAWKIPLLNLLWAIDLKQPIDNYLHINSGLEYWFMNTIALRVGYRYKWFGNDLGTLSGLTSGMGFQVNNLFGTLDMELDYAFVPYGDLGFTHRVSLTARFGTSVELPESEPVKGKTADELKQEIISEVDSKIAVAAELALQNSDNISNNLNKINTDITTISDNMKVIMEKLNTLDEKQKAQVLKDEAKQEINTEKDEANKLPENINMPSDNIKQETKYETYEVQQGDNLHTIAKKFYGTSAKWNIVYEANKDTMKTPDNIKIGNKLKIPKE
ncbi:MAG: PorV/PorQ family protein [Candidatus Firestonebacteria bacterium]